MDIRPRALDLFCGAGGATKGLQQAGFHVTGVDVRPQPRYIGDRFFQADALTFLITGFDLIWASPPCQRYTPGAARWGTSDSHPDLIAPIRERLTGSGTMYIIENVATARRHLHSPLMLCGIMFPGLKVFRHRLFETSFPVEQPPHSKHTAHIGQDGWQTVTGHAGGSSKRDGWKAGGVSEWRKAMGIDWMTGDELAESIPPAYAEYVASQYLNASEQVSELRTSLIGGSE